MLVLDLILKGSVTLVSKYDTMMSYRGNGGNGLVIIDLCVRWRSAAAEKGPLVPSE